MSHIVVVTTQVRDVAAVRAACQRLGLPQPVQGTTKLFSGEAEGLAVQLPDWVYPVVATLPPATSSSTISVAAGANSTTLIGFSKRMLGEGQGRGPSPGPRCHVNPVARRLDQADHPGGRCGMSRTIEIIVSPNGETTVTTQGFAGHSCRDASKFIEQALGQRTASSSPPSSTRPRRSNSNNSDPDRVHSPGLAVQIGPCPRMERISRSRNVRSDGRFWKWNRWLGIGSSTNRSRPEAPSLRASA